MILCSVLDEGPVSSLVHLCMSGCDCQVLDRSTDELDNETSQRTFHAILAPSRLVDQAAILRQLSTYAPVIIVDDKPTIGKAVNAIRNGAYDYIPVGTQQELSDAILTSVLESDAAIGLFNLEREILGNCDEIKEIRSLVRKVAPTEGSVVLHGATGTGKNLVAKCIHATSNRSEGPFVKLDCDRVPPDRVMNELFGNGQSETHTGRVLASSSGTLFLNEVGSLPSEAQSALLHLLDHNEIQQYGQDHSIPADVRIIVASVFPLDTLADLGRIGRGLCTRLSRFRLVLPPLTERGEDIVLLAEDKLRKHSSSLGKSGMKFHPSTLSRMMQYDWPGNVRELDQAVERAVLVSEATSILPEDLGIDTIPPPQRPVEQSSGEFTSLEDYFIEFVRTNEERYTETELAEKLGISRKSLWERRNKLGIPRRRAKVKRLHT